MVSVIVPNWNGKHFLEECLNCLRDQTYQDFEIIVVDNGSIDGSVEFVKKTFPEGQIISLPLNKGFSGAANEGIKSAKGKFIALLNNDTMVDDRWLEELVKGISGSEDIGFCASKVFCLPRKGEIDSAGDSYTRYGVAFKRRDRIGKNVFLQRELVFGACAVAALYRSSMLEEIGDFDEDFFCLYEDVDLSFRAQLAGYKCLYVPTAIVYHRVGGTAGTDNDFTLYYGQRNLELVFLKNMPLPLLIKYLPLHTGYVILAFIYHLLRREGKIFLYSKMDALKRIRSTLQKRKIIQRKKKVSVAYSESIIDKRSLFKYVIHRM